MSNELVLIVEDEFAIAELLEMALKDSGYRIALAANGRQGLERLAEGPLPDLIISDFMMPVLNGAGMLSAMSNNELHRAIPCILISSIPEEAVRRHIDRYNGFVRKPFRLSTVVQLVAMTLGKASKQGDGN
jgi:CheY-like chemotaxis protein